MASSSSNFVNLKSKYDALVKKDEDINKEYNKILHTCLEQVLSDMRMRDATFGRLFREVYYGGSYFDRLAVGNLRHEFDLDIIFRVPDTAFEITNPDRKNKANFMEFSTRGKNIAAFKEIVQNDMISSERMKQVLKAAADKVVVSNGGYHVTLENGVRVNVTRRDKLPYTLLLKPQSGRHCQTVEVDLVPALRVSNAKLPADVRNRLQCIQSKAGTNVDHFLAIAMPVVSKDKLEVDFPRVSRDIFKERPSAKMAIRLMKQERNEKGGSMGKVWSHAIKVAAIHEVLENPERGHWREARLELRFFELRNALQRYLRSGYMTDPYFPEINMMGRIKSQKVKDEVATYLDRSAKSVEPGFAKDTECPSGECNKMFKSRDAAEEHARKAHGSSNLRGAPCPSGQCNRTFASSGAADQHFRDSHARGLGHGSELNTKSPQHVGGTGGTSSTAGKVALGVGIGVGLLGLAAGAAALIDESTKERDEESVRRERERRRRQNRNDTDECIVS